MSKKNVLRLERWMAFFNRLTEATIDVPVPDGVDPNSPEFRVFLQGYTVADKWWRETINKISGEALNGLDPGTLYGKDVDGNEILDSAVLDEGHLPGREN